MPKRDQVLSSWPDIARVLGVSIITALHWEKLHGLPVHRLLGGRIVAYREELENWAKQKGIKVPRNDTRSSLARWVLSALLAASVLLLSLGVFKWLWQKGVKQPKNPPTQYTSKPNYPSHTDVKGYREVFYATDRVMGADGVFGTDASEEDELQFGRVVVSIPLTHTRGEIERPWKIFSVSLPEDARHHFVITTRRDLINKNEFFNGVTSAIDAAPDKEMFVFVHGFNVAFDDALLRTAQLAWDMKIRGPALTYSWPSAAATRRYVSDLDMADWSAPHLALFLQDLRLRTGTRTIHLVAHSMGSRVLSVALDRLALVDPKAIAHFQEVVLAAPDINNRVLSQLSKALKAEADRITIYASDRDLALRASGFIRWTQARAGSNAFAIKLATACDIIDATRAKSSLLGHSYFAEDTVLLNDLALLLKQRLGPDQRSITLDRDGPIWVFRP